jgi:hypothetical protein
LFMLVAGLAKRPRQDAPAESITRLDQHEISTAFC